MILILESQNAAGLNAAGKIRIAAGDKNQVPFQRSVRRNGAGTKDACVKPEIRAEELESRAFRQELGCGAGGKKLLAVKREQNLILIEQVNFDAEGGVLVFGAAGDFADAGRESGILLSGRRGGPNQSRRNRGEE